MARTRILNVDSGDGDHGDGGGRIASEVGLPRTPWSRSVCVCAVCRVLVAAEASIAYL